jgi:hypothetical protein
MMTFILSFLVVSIAILGMSVGILAGRRPIQGGCGGKDREIGAGIGCGSCGVEGRDGNPAALREGRHANDWS